VVLHPPSDAVVAQFDGVSRRASLFPAAAPQPVLIVPQVTSAFSPDVRASIGYLDAHDDTGNLKSPISMEVPRQHHSQPAPSMATNILPSEGCGPSENLASS